MKISSTPQLCQALDQAVQDHYLSSPQLHDMGYLQLQQTDEEMQVQRCAAITKLVKWQSGFEVRSSCSRAHDPFFNNSTLNYGVHTIKSITPCAPLEEF